MTKLVNKKNSAMAMRKSNFSQVLKVRKMTNFLNSKKSETKLKIKSLFLREKTIRSHL